MPYEGFEPPYLSALDPKSSVSANFTNRALVAGPRVELGSLGYEPNVLPLHHPTIIILIIITFLYHVIGFMLAVGGGVEPPRGL